VLPVFVGRATRACEFALCDEKAYTARFRLGIVTDTQDITGEVLEKRNVNVSEAEVVAAAESFVGDILQTPPMYSAIKIDGTPLYKLAREGKTVERKAREIRIDSVSVRRVGEDEYEMDVSCSKGTYIRTLCHDIGQKLSCGACMEELKRTKVSTFGLEDSLTLSEISSIVESTEGISSKLISVETIFEMYPKIITIEKYDRMLYNGNSVAPFMLDTVENVVLEDDKRYRMYDSIGQFIGIFYYNKKEKLVKCDKMFFAAK
jgi:tRNA pseudouridine55 synthase